MQTKTFNLIVYLGAPNSSNGELSPTAISRLDEVHKIYKYSQIPCQLLLTGGFGKHFNNSSMPHHCYAKKYLLEEKSLATNTIFHTVTSANTMEDIKLSNHYITQTNLNPNKIFIITSDFHINRTKVIFFKTYPDHLIQKTTFKVAKSNFLNSKQLLALKKIEKIKIAKILTQ